MVDTSVGVKIFAAFTTMILISGLAMTFLVGMANETGRTIDQQYNYEATLSSERVSSQSALDELIIKQEGSKIDKEATDTAQIADSTGTIEQEQNYITIFSSFASVFQGLLPESPAIPVMIAFVGVLLSAILIVSFAKFVRGVN